MFGVVPDVDAKRLAPDPAAVAAVDDDDFIDGGAAGHGGGALLAKKIQTTKNIPASVAITKNAKGLSTSEHAIRMHMRTTSSN